jgi:bacterioferritin
LAALPPARQLGLQRGRWPGRGKELIEEMQHADKLIERIIFFDGSPNMQTLKSLHIGKTVKAVLDSDLQAELSARSLYAEAATHCHSVKDSVTRDLFEQLMHDEEEHIDFLGNSDRTRCEDRP